MLPVIYFKENAHFDFFTLPLPLLTGRGNWGSLPFQGERWGIGDPPPFRGRDGEGVKAQQSAPAFTLPCPSLRGRGGLTGN